MQWKRFCILFTSTWTGAHSYFFSGNKHLSTVKTNTGLMTRRAVLLKWKLWKSGTIGALAETAPDGPLNETM